MLLKIINKIVSSIVKKFGKKKAENMPLETLPVAPPIVPHKIYDGLKHELWKTSCCEADVAYKFFQAHGLDIPCGLKLKDGRIVLPLYDINLKIKCEVLISDEGEPVGVKLQIGDHFLVGNDKPAFVVPDILSACILFQELGITSATYISNNNIPAMAKLFPKATFVTAGDGAKIAMKSGSSVIDLTENGQPVSIYERFIKGDELAGLLGGKTGIAIKPLWIALRSFRACEWILKGYIAAGPSLCILFSPSGLGKTFVVLDIFLTLAYGLSSWHGVQCKKARCLYMCAEGYAAVMPRVQCWLEQHEVADSHSVDFWIENGSITLDDPESVAELQEYLNHRFGPRKPDIIAVDTLNLFMKGDENATQSATAFVQALKSISVENNCTILLVHHTGVADERRGRGSTVFKGSLDTELRLSREKDNPDILIFDQTKNRMGRLMDVPIAFLLEEHETSFEFESGDKVTSCVLKRLGEVPVSKKPAQEELDVELLVDAFKKSYSVCPNSLILSKDQLKVFAKDKWKEKDSAEISRQINPNQDTRWLGRLIKAGIVESDGAGTSFRVVKELVIDTIGKAFENKEAPN